MRVKYFLIAVLVVANTTISGLAADYPVALESHRAPPNPNHKRPTVALALGGGGIRGAAHIGVLRALQEAKIPIDYIAGSSMGAVVGGLYAAGVPLDHIEKIVKDKSLSKAFAPLPIQLAALKLPARKIRYAFSDEKPYAGIFKGNKLQQFIAEIVPDEKQNFKNLDIPFCVAVTSLTDGKSYRITEGNICEAITASAALAPLIRPQVRDGHLFVDGGFRANIPTVAAAQFNPDIIIAVSVNEQLGTVDAKEFTRMRRVVDRLCSIGLSVMDSYHLELADIAIITDVNGIPTLSKKASHVDQAVAEGERATVSSLAQIKQKISNWKPSQLARHQRDGHYINWQ